MAGQDAQPPHPGEAVSCDGRGATLDNDSCHCISYITYALVCESRYALLSLLLLAGITIVVIVAGDALT